MKANMTERTKLFEEVKAICKERKIPKSTLAKELGVSETAVSKWYKGTCVPTPKYCEKIKVWLNKQPENKVRKDVDIVLLRKKCMEFCLPQEALGRIVGEFKRVDDIPVKGITESGVKKIATVFGLKEEDIYIKAEEKTHQKANYEDEIRRLKCENARLKEMLLENRAELEKEIAGCKRTVGAIVGALYKELDIKVGKEA